ncbi:MAG: sugar ABC transporter permease [Candidatus Omnitrophica bacterium]|nr:sugar ABC transporter permease [Candidatus Omnitrophota bacterium]MCA9426265.1 sugar ABC transporter permease [Candidatus Omnitrophota bacterium]MCA9442723.1 sugar ABC transporter permease [Candidatus Omnitrophota bacterium]MCA9448220.1 sugar ABC transporter permease [Candidatus Omnitrophota bacterium]MCB9769530.1 sugar ABC transporter permease [Candidatus Omnitrophota bacterium]
MTKGDRHNLFLGLLFVSPWLIGFVVFMAYPIFASLYYSLCHYSVLADPVFIGTKNYTNLFQDSVFRKALTNTLIYAAMALPLNMLVALGLAVLLHHPIPGRGLFRTMFFLPSLVPLVAIAILWSWLLNTEYGLVNHLLSLVNVPPIDWLGSTQWSKVSMVLPTTWGVGGMIVIYLASLQEVPQHLYEAARLDGARFWRQFWHVTLPLISPVVYFNLIMTIITLLQVFIIPYIMTKGGPARSTLFYVQYIYDTAFRFLRMGYASAMAWILFLVIMLLTLIATWATAKRIYYSAD